MKNIAVSLALGAALISTSALAADQRPAAPSFAPAAKSAAPATPVVAKRKALRSEALLPVAAGVGAAGVGLALLIKDNDNDTASPQ